MHVLTAVISLAAMAKGGSMIKALNIIAPLTIVAIIGGAAYLLQRWWRRRHPAAGPEEDSGGWTGRGLSE